VLKRNNRIRKSTLINHILKQEKRIQGIAFSMHRLESKNSYERFAVLVSKKISKSAVTRNTVRRQIMEVIRLSLKEDKIHTSLNNGADNLARHALADNLPSTIPSKKTEMTQISYDTVIVAKIAILNTGFANLKTEFERFHINSINNKKQHLQI